MITGKLVAWPLGLLVRLFSEIIKKFSFRKGNMPDFQIISVYPGIKKLEGE